MEKIKLVLLFCMLSSPFGAVAQNVIDWTGRSSVFTNGVSDLVSFIDLGEVPFWGFLDVSLTDSYSNANTAGLYRKTFNLGTTVTTFSSNTSQVSEAIGPVCAQWKLGEFQRDANNHLVVPIYHLNALGNRITVNIKGISLGVINTADFLITTAQVIVNNETRDYPFSREKMAIGTSKHDADAYLTVGGNINARELKIKVDAGADFVFDNDYALPELAHIEEYINLNKHLPDIPSANAMRQNGLAVGGFQIKLLQKIEELTLHLIRQQKEMEMLKKLVTGKN